MGMILLSYLLSNAFVGSRPWYWHVFEISLMLVSNYFASATFQSKVIITILNSDVYWITCEMDIACDLLCWITTILACMLVGLKSLMILLDYRSYMGSSARIWSLQWLFLYLCSYNLDGSVTHYIYVYWEYAYVEGVHLIPAMHFHLVGCGLKWIFYRYLTAQSCSML
jgi:hypothetical protein